MHGGTAQAAQLLRKKAQATHCALAGPRRASSIFNTNGHDKIPAGCCNYCNCPDELLGAAGDLLEVPRVYCTVQLSRARLTCTAGSANPRLSARNGATRRISLSVCGPCPAGVRVCPAMSGLPERSNCWSQSSRIHILSCCSALAGDRPCMSLLAGRRLAVTMVRSADCGPSVPFNSQRGPPNGNVWTVGLQLCIARMQASFPR